MLLSGERGQIEVRFFPDHPGEASGQEGVLRVEGRRNSSLLNLGKAWKALLTVLVLRGRLLM